MALKSGSIQTNKRYPLFVTQCSCWLWIIRRGSRSRSLTTLEENECRTHWALSRKNIPDWTRRTRGTLSCYHGLGDLSIHLCYVEYSSPPDLTGLYVIQTILSQQKGIKKRNHEFALSLRSIVPTYRTIPKTLSLTVVPPIDVLSLGSISPFLITLPKYREKERNGNLTDNRWLLALEFLKLVRFSKTSDVGYIGNLITVSRPLKSR